MPKDIDPIFREALESIEDWGNRLKFKIEPFLVGDGLGNIFVPDRDGWIYARAFDSDDIIEARNYLDVMDLVEDDPIYLLQAGMAFGVTPAYAVAIGPGSGCLESIIFYLPNDPCDPKWTIGVYDVDEKFKINAGDSLADYSLFELSSSCVAKLIAGSVEPQAVLQLETYNATITNQSILRFQKSHDDTVGTKTETVDNDRLGIITFFGVDTGGNADLGAYILAIQDGSVGTMVPTKLVFMTYDDLGNANEFSLSSSCVAKLVAGGAAPQAELRLETYNATITNASLLGFLKSHDDTAGIKTETIDNDILGTIAFFGVDTGGNFDLGARIRALQAGSAGVMVPTKLVFTTYDDLGNANDGLWIDPDGNVGGITGQPMFGVPGTLTVADDQAITFICGHPNGLTLVDTASFVKTAPTGATIIFDIELSTDDGANWVTIYSVLPSIAIGSRVGTSGTLSITTMDQDDLLRLNIDQVGSTIAGAWLTASLRVESR